MSEATDVVYDAGWFRLTTAEILVGEGTMNNPGKYGYSKLLSGNVRINPPGFKNRLFPVWIFLSGIVSIIFPMSDPPTSFIVSIILFALGLLVWKFQKTEYILCLEFENEEEEQDKRSVVFSGNDKKAIINIANIHNILTKKLGKANWTLAVKEKENQVRDVGEYLSTYL
jgi:hypothetical protein